MVTVKVSVCSVLFLSHLSTFCSYFLYKCKYFSLVFHILLFVNLPLMKLEGKSAEVAVAELCFENKILTTEPAQAPDQPFAELIISNTRDVINRIRLNPTQGSVHH